MTQRKLNNYPRLVCGMITLLLLAFSLVLATGVTFGRYITTTEETLRFVVKPEAKIYAVSLANAETANGTTLTFTLNNTLDDTNIPEDDVNFYVRVFVPSDVTVDGQIPTLRLTVGDNWYDAVGEELDGNTPLFREYGNGYIFTLQDEGGEISHTLKGGISSSLTVTVTALGMTETDGIVIKTEKISNN